VEVIKDWPPNISQIIRKFPLDGYNPVFTYGDKLYNPGGDPISQDLMIHEQTHEQQQATYGVEQWWAMYLENPAFRLTQETEAYRNQYQFLKTVFNRKGRMAALNKLADNLSSPLYGSIIKKFEAKELINS
jgi:hypothetical protein